MSSFRWRCAQVLVLASVVTTVAWTIRAPAQSQGITIYLVRHAEPLQGAGDDPPLSPDGKKRAAELGEKLKTAGLGALITSTFRRTKETAEPAGRRYGLPPHEIGFEKGLDAHIQEVAAAGTGGYGGGILVVGHSNTITKVIALLGGPKMDDLCETTFDLMFTVKIKDGKTDVQQSSYGDSSPPGTGCL
jgi:broad specificity phosphatase PhoE